ncbi:MAG: helix-turn-helix domain-containing protein [Christensenellaceae bacterium]|nr:helix-turn-helix domain-containing protein [Christensenellaceae bacterium]
MAHIHYYMENNPSSAAFAPRLLYTGRVSDDPNWFNVSHSHSFCEILYVLRGQGHAVLGEHKHALKAGDLVIIDPGVPHEESSSPSDALQLIFLAADNFQLGELEPNHLHLEDASPVIHTGSQRPIIERYFSDLLTETGSQVEYFSAMSQALLSALLIFCMRLQMTTGKASLSPECRRVQEYINQNYTKPITLDSLSESVFISKHHLAHVFKDQTGVSPIKYLIERRIEEAKTLLANQALSVREVAARVGYDDPVYFSQVFKKAVGCSPAAYRTKK